MNRRILKKKSKMAKEILLKYFNYQEDEFFRAEKNNNYHEMVVDCSCTKKRCRCSWHPLKGTIMWGEYAGYYEKEWIEMTAWGLLDNLVMWSSYPEDVPPQVLTKLGITIKEIEDFHEWLEDQI